MIDGQAQGGADFRAVLAQATDIDDAAERLLTGGDDKGQAVAVEVVDPLAAWEAIPRMLRPLVVGTLPEVAPAWTDEALREWARSAQRAFPESQGIPPMPAFVMSSAGLVLPVVLAVKLRRDAMAKARRPAAPGEGGAAAGVIPESQGMQDGPQGG